MSQSSPAVESRRVGARRRAIALFHNRVIAFGTLSRPLRRLALGVIALVVASGLLLAAPGLPTPVLATGTAGGARTQVSLAIYLLTLLSFALGWALAVTAALRLRLGPRALLLALVVALLGSVPASRLLAGGASAGGPLGAEVWLRLVQLLALGGMVGWAVAATLGAGGRAGKGAGDGAQPGRLGHTFWVVLALMSCYSLADLGSIAATGQARGDSQALGAIATQTRYLPTILAVVVYWGSTDFIEWGQAAAAGMTFITRRLRTPAVFFGVVALISAAFLADLIRLFGVPALLPAVGTSLVAIAAVALLARLAQVDGEWPAQVPMSALLAGVAFLFVFFQLANAVVAYLAPRLPAAELNPLYTVISVAAAGTLLLLALGLIARGRARQRSQTRAAGLFLAMMGLLFIALSTPQLANVFGLPVVPAMQPTVPAFKFIVLSSTLVALGWLALRGRLTGALAEPFAAVLSLVMGLQVIAWFFFLLQPALSALSSVSVIVAALFFLVAILWDFVMSGEQVTNRSSGAFPRDARVLLYLGYTLISSATIVYLKSVRIAGTGNAVPLGSENDMLEQFGAVGLGLPLIAYTFLQGLARGRSASRREEPVAAPASARGGGPRRRRQLGSPIARTAIVPLGSALVLSAMLLLAACAQNTPPLGGGTSVGQAGTPTGTVPPVDTATTRPSVATATPRPPTPTATPRPPTATPTRAPVPTPTIAVISSSTVAAWSIPSFNQPQEGQNIQATSVSNGVGSYSIQLNATFDPHDARFVPPVVVLLLDYQDPMTGADKQIPLTSNQTATVTLSAPCPSRAVDFTAEVFVHNVNGYFWQGENTSTPVKQNDVSVNVQCPPPPSTVYLDVYGGQTFPVGSPATLVAGTNGPVTNTGYEIDIKDTNGTVYVTCKTGSTCQVQVTENAPTTLWVEAFVEESPSGPSVASSGNAFPVFWK